MSFFFPFSLQSTNKCRKSLYFLSLVWSQLLVLSLTMFVNISRISRRKCGCNSSFDWSFFNGSLEKKFVCILEQRCTVIHVTTCSAKYCCHALNFNPFLSDAHEGYFVHYLEVSASHYHNFQVLDSFIAEILFINFYHLNTNL